MKRNLLALFACGLALTGARADVAINATNFPDENFRLEMENNADANQDGVLSDEEIAAVNDYFLRLDDVVNFKGIEYFYDGLKSLLIGGLNCPEPEKVTSFDVSKFKVLESLEITDYPFITSLDLSKNTKLKNAFISSMKGLTSIKLPAGLETLRINFTPNVTSLDLAPCKNSLNDLDLYCGGVKELDLTDYKELRNIIVGGFGEDIYPLTLLNLTGCENLIGLSLDCTAIETVTCKNLPNINAINVSNNEIKSFLVEDCAILSSIEGENNDIHSLNIKKCPVLWLLRVNNNKMRELIIDESPGLTVLNAEHNKLMWLDMSNVKKDISTEDAEFRVDDQRPDVVAVKLSPTETGLLVHSRFDIERVKDLRAKGTAQTPRETTVDGIRYFVFYDNGPDTPNLVGSDCGYVYETKWPYHWIAENSKDNNLPVTLNVYKWTKHQAFLKLSESSVRGKYSEPAPTAPTVTRSQDYDGKITFSSSNEAVVKIDANTGALTVVGAGTAVISVKGEETDYRLAPAVVTYTVTIDKASPVFAFEQASITVDQGQDVPANALTIQMYDGTVQYTSSNEDIATVDANGRVTLVNDAGEVTITATGPETSNCNATGTASYVITVNAVDGIEATPMENGKWRMEDEIFNLAGQRVTNGRQPRGIYVVKGKKKTLH